MIGGDARPAVFHKYLFFADNYRDLLIFNK